MNFLLWLPDSGPPEPATRDRNPDPELNLSFCHKVVEWHNH
jgi:hypothetical protein